MLKELLPPGAQRGRTIILTLKGEGLVPGAKMMTTLPGTVSRLALPKNLETPDTQLSFLLQLPEDAPVGLYPIRLHTEEGLSNVLIFSLGDFPEISEEEPNDSIAEAQPIGIPMTINGHLQGPEQDFYHFSARAGERLVFEVEARRMGSAIDPAVEVLDSTGRRIAANDDAPGLGVDARLEVTFPKTGTHYVVVHDSKYSEHAENFYRLKVGSYAFAEGIFPLGWQRGKSVEVTFFGGNLEKPVKVRLNLDVPSEKQSVPINLPGPKPIGSLPFQFQVSDLPEVLAPADGSVARLEPSTVVNGCIRKPGQVHQFKFKVLPGQKWLFSLEAASLGTSDLYGSLTVYDPQGKRLPAKDVAGGPDPKLALTVPDKVGEVTLAVGDVRGLGGWSHSYRLLATPGSGDFTLKILTPYVNVPAAGTTAVQVVAERHGYEGPIQLSLPNLPDDLLAGGGNIPGELTDYSGIRRQSNFGYLTLTAKPEAEPRTFQLSVWGQGGPARDPIRRRAQGAGLMLIIKGEFEEYDPQGDPLPPKPFTASWLGMDLPAAVSKPSPATLQIASPSLRLVQGMELPIEWKLVKRDPGVRPLSVGGLPLPFNKDINFHRSGESKIGDAGSISLRSTLDAPLITVDAVLSATVEINGKEETLTSPALTVQVVRGYSIALASERMELKSGGKIELAGTVHREVNFPGTVNIMIGDPPDKVSCPAVVVPDGKSDFHLVCEAAPGAPEGDFEVHLVSSATVPGRTDKREFSIPPVSARMVLRGGKPTEGAVSNTP